MNAIDACTTMVLDARTSQVLMAAAGVELQCVAGEVWLTQYGDSRDIILAPGERFVLELPNAVVGARHGATLRVCRGRREASPWRGMARWLSWFDPRWGSRVGRGLVGRWPVRSV